jgi:hypothetical protein
LLEGVHFQPFQVNEMKVNRKVRQKVDSWNGNFHKWKEIWIYKRCLNWFPFQRRAWKKRQLWYLVTMLIHCV